MKTRIACYFDVPRPDNKSDDINWVDVRAREPRVRLQIFRPFRLPPIATHSIRLTRNIHRPPSPSNDNPRST